MSLPCHAKIHNTNDIKIPCIHMKTIKYLGSLYSNLRHGAGYTKVSMLSEIKLNHNSVFPDTCL